MKKMPDKRLLNPAFYALCEAQAPFSIGNDHVKRYASEVLGVIAHDHRASNTMDVFCEWMAIGEALFLVGKLPKATKNVEIVEIIPCFQMIRHKKIEVAAIHKIEKLTQNAEMVELINISLPGFFSHDTPRLGNYFGIRSGEKLVAMTGERFRLEGFSEISAVGTHPDFLGQKMAQQLVAHVSNSILEAGKIPFLHTGTNNERAIRVYEFLGFEKTRIIDWTKIKRVG